MKKTVIVCAVAILALLPVVSASGCLPFESERYWSSEALIIVGLIGLITGSILLIVNTVRKRFKKTWKRWAAVALGGLALLMIGVFVVTPPERYCNSEIYVMDADGSHQRNLTNNPADDVAPVWSPDGSRIAFVSDRKEYESDDIYVMDADGSHQRNLTNNLAVDVNPVWSPDGSRLAFTSYRDGNSEIYVMDADGSNQTRLTDDPAWDEDPAWSPDGSCLAFLSNRDGNSEIYVMDADGSNQTRLTNNPDQDGYHPTWSPDGSRLVFEWLLWLKPVPSH